MLHKFEGIEADVDTGEDIIVLIDEAHRSPASDLGNYLFGALPNATVIGFTGTPIDKTAHGRGTFKTFGIDDEGYLDKYSIAESIQDGTTVPLHYALTPNAMQVPEQQLEEEFLALADAEGVSDVEELNRVLDRAISLKAFLKSTRTGRVAYVSAWPSAAGCRTLRLLAAIAAFHATRHLDTGGDTELLEQVAEVGLDRLDAQEQLRGDLGVGLARDDEPRHLQLAVAERL